MSSTHIEAVPRLNAKMGCQSVCASPALGSCHVLVSPGFDCAGRAHVLQYGIRRRCWQSLPPLPCRPITSRAFANRRAFLVMVVCSVTVLCKGLRLLVYGRALSDRLMPTETVDPDPGVASPPSRLLHVMHDLSQATPAA